MRKEGCSTRAEAYFTRRCLLFSDPHVCFHPPEESAIIKSVLIILMRLRREIDLVHITVEPLRVLTHIPFLDTFWQILLSPLFFLGIGHVGEFFTMNMLLAIASTHHSKRSVGYPLTAVRIIKTVMNSAVVLLRGVAGLSLLSIIYLAVEKVPNADTN